MVTRHRPRRRAHRPAGPGPIPDPFVGDNEPAWRGWPRQTGNIAISLPSRPSSCASRTSGWFATGWTRWRLDSKRSRARQHRKHVPPISLGCEATAQRRKKMSCGSSSRRSARHAGAETGDPHPARRLAGPPRRLARAQGALPVRLGLGAAAPAGRHLERHPAGRATALRGWRMSTCGSTMTAERLKVALRLRLTRSGRMPVRWRWP